jgi:hypothetical protein
MLILGGGWLFMFFITAFFLPLVSLFDLSVVGSAVVSLYWWSLSFLLCLFPLV